MEDKDTIFHGSSGTSETESPPLSSEFLHPARGMDVITTTEQIFGGSPVVHGGNGVVGGGEGSGRDLFGSKKKRGRPRKYDPDGSLNVNYVGKSTPLLGVAGEFSSSSKRGRGRPSGSGNWQLLASLGEVFASTAGGDFTPHVMTVNTGEDVAEKILSFAHKGPRGICILSANGAVSNVTLRQPGSSGGILTYEGRFEILSLSGSFTVTDNCGVKSRSGGLSVSLAGPDGRVIGGGVAGLLMASNPIQIVVGSFIPNGYKVHKRKQERQQSYGISPASDTIISPDPISQAKADHEIHIGPISPLQGPINVAPTGIPVEKPISNALFSHGASWNGFVHTASDHRPYPDINLSVPVE